MTDFDRLATLNPVNALAARQLGRGIEWTPAAGGNAHNLRWDAPPRDLLQPIPHEGHRSTFVDLTGRQSGRLTVVGYLGKPNRKAKARWLVRCACGDYEVRGARAVTNPQNANDRCDRCKYLDQVKRGNGRGALGAAPTNGGE